MDWKELYGPTEMRKEKAGGSWYIPWEVWDRMYGKAQHDHHVRLMRFMVRVGEAGDDADASSSGAQ